LVVIFDLFLFFFFQAEDGIRDFHVTGVQTCALPILSWIQRTPCPAAHCLQAKQPLSTCSDTRTNACPRTEHSSAENKKSETLRRSEERRVGKECRSLWSP